MRNYVQLENFPRPEQNNFRATEIIRETVLQSSHPEPFNWIQLKSAIFVWSAAGRRGAALFSAILFIILNRGRTGGDAIDNAIRLLRGHFLRYIWKRITDKKYIPYWKCWNCSYLSIPNLCFKRRVDKICYQSLRTTYAFGNVLSHLWSRRSPSLNDAAGCNFNLQTNTGLPLASPLI